MKKMFRQGDLLFVKVDKASINAVPSENTVLAYGETEGHAHVVEQGEVLRAGEMVWVVAEPGTVIKHDGSPGDTDLHDPIELDEGTWEVRRQRQQGIAFAEEREPRLSFAND